MKYTYAYKTSDGTRHEASMEARCREDVFVELRKQGIKAIKVVAADGSKANGEVRGVRKRAVVALVILVAIAVGAIAFREGSRSGTSDVAAIKAKTITLLSDTTRRQVIGDVAIINKGIRSGWSDVFSSEGDRFLASFAIPGVKAGIRQTSIEEITRALNETNTPSINDSLEARQIMAMVEGMKQEARAYLASGGSVVEYGNRLTERQDAEISIYERVQNEILSAQKTMKDEDFTSFYEKRNDELRNLGIRPVVLPE